MAAPRTGVEFVSFAPGELVAGTGRLIVERHRAALPDLSSLTVVVPGIQAAAPLARALVDAAGLPALRLPRLTTLAAWAETVPLERPVATAAGREAALYEALSQRRWLARDDLWAVAAELGALFDDLTRWRVRLPDDLADFTRRLEAAYEARAGESLAFEARLVHELWIASVRDTDVLDPAAAYQLRLARLAAEAAGPLVAVGLDRLAPAEADFIERHAARWPVTVVTADRSGSGDPVGSVLAAAWFPDEPAPLLDRATALAGSFPANPLAERLVLHGANGAEQEARAVDVAVRRWLLAGHRSIGVIVQDRVVARRARALLERAGVLVRDESGWALSTTSAATVIGRWLDAVSGGFHHRDLLDLLKSPFVFHDRPRDERRAVVWRFEQALRRRNVKSGLDRFAEATDDAAARTLLARVQAAARLLGHQRRRTLAGWLDALVASLEAIGVRAGLAADAAGEPLLDLLDGLAHGVREARLAVSFSEWRRWLSRQIEAATFRDQAIESPVVFTHLGATALRRFDVVVMPGCDAAKLPGQDAGGLFFNQGVRASLGLPTRVDAVEALTRELAALVATAGEVLVTWQASVEGEARLLSPLFERLRAITRCAWDDDLADPLLGALADAARVPSPDPFPLPEPAAAPAPGAPAALLPRAVSASGYNSLLACPYQFHARYLLRLAEADEVQEALEKRDYGTRVHAVLAAFHAAHPRVTDLDPAVAEQALLELSDAAFRGDIAVDYLAIAWLERWKQLVPAYVAWQRLREADGWTFEAGETDARVEIVTPAGRRFALRGRIDRADRRPDGAVAVLDYKTQDLRTVEAKAGDPGEDVQLPVYVLLAGEGVDAALYVALDKDTVESIALEGDLAGHAAGQRDRLAGLYDRMAEGAPLPANGVDAVCAWCEVAGLCRRSHWA